MSTGDGADKIHVLGHFRGITPSVVKRIARLIGWVLYYFPLFGQQASQHRNRISLEPYSRPLSFWRSALSAGALPALFILCPLYGFFFGLTVPYLIVGFVLPIAAIAALIIWALPQQRAAPTTAIEFLFPCTLIALIMWPNYVAIALPGMPWITALRLVSLPLAACFLTCLSVSAEFRRRMSEAVSASGPVWILICALTIVQIATLVISPQPTISAQIVFNHFVHFTLTFLISCLLFQDIRYVERYWFLLCALAVPICIEAAFENSRHYIPYAEHIPAILRVSDPSVTITLTPQFRPGINLYRAKGTFSTALQLAEYLALLTPFLLHFAFKEQRLVARVAAIALIPTVFVVIRMTDARLGVVGMLASILLYGAFWAIQRWQKNPRDLLASALLYAWPAVLIAGVALVFVSRRASILVFGDGAQAGSTAARDSQLSMAFSALRRAPWGHGGGQSGNALGYGQGAFVTVDNFFITLAIDYGILGIIFWYGAFITAVVQATRYAISNKYAGREEAILLPPLAVGLTAFLVIKWVHGQDYNHPIYFMMLGMIVALIHRLRKSQPQAVTEVRSEDHAMSKPRSRTSRVE